MNIRLDFNGIEQDFKFNDQVGAGKCRLKHNTGIKIKVLPYKTKNTYCRGFKSVFWDYRSFLKIDIQSKGER